MLLNFNIFLRMEHFPKTIDKHLLRISYKLNAMQMERIQRKDFALDRWVNNMSIFMANETSCHWFTSQSPWSQTLRLLMPPKLLKL